jgi:DNA-binding CsgD family transcriptional regulator
MAKKKDFIERDLFKLRNLGESRKANPELSDRERQVLALLLQLFNYREIGVRLNISKSTVRFHTGRIVAKLHFPSRLELLKHSLRPEVTANDPLQGH